MSRALLYAVTAHAPAGAPSPRGGVSSDMLRVADVMTRKVVTVTGECAVQDAAREMVRHDLGGLPVVDREGRVAGIVTAGDLVVRLRPRRSPGWWALLVSPDRLAREYQRRAGMTVGEVMTSPVVTVAPEATIGAAAALLDEHHVGRLPVVADGMLVGILGRLDLVRLVTAIPDAAAQRSDADLAAEMKACLGKESWAPRDGLMIASHRAVLWLAGVVDSDFQRAAIETMARSIAGCRGVENHLINRRTLAARRI